MEVIRIEMMLGMLAFAMENVVALAGFCFVLFPVFWTVTFGVIMCMDLLECALHTLRLHWVEF
jgi:vacuolar-type H+-ATPase subunit I/STV1